LPNCIGLLFSFPGDNMAVQNLDLIVVVFFILLIPFLFYKRKRQIGMPWEPGVSARVSINNHPLSCQICKCNYFYKREALIPTTFVSLFRIPFFNQSGSAYVCQSCGFIHWFSRPRETSVEPISERSREKSFDHNA
jgi:hypothetical protein